MICVYGWAPRVERHCVKSACRDGVGRVLPKPNLLDHRKKENQSRRVTTALFWRFEGRESLPLTILITGVGFGEAPTYRKNLASFSAHSVLFLSSDTPPVSKNEPFE